MFFPAYDLRLSQRWLWRMLSSRMLRCVDLALTDVSEERIVSIFRVEKSASGEPAWAGGCRLSHQSETTSYIRTGREGDYATGESSERRVGSVVKVNSRELRDVYERQGIGSSRLTNLTTIVYFPIFCRHFKSPLPTLNNIESSSA
jgi:hypothetical protein